MVTWLGSDFSSVLLPWSPTNMGTCHMYVHVCVAEGSVRGSMAFKQNRDLVPGILHSGVLGASPVLLMPLAGERKAIFLLEFHCSHLQDKATEQGELALFWWPVLGSESLWSLQKPRVVAVSILSRVYRNYLWGASSSGAHSLRPEAELLRILLWYTVCSLAGPAL